MNRRVWRKTLKRAGVWCEPVGGTKEHGLGAFCLIGKTERKLALRE